MSGFCESTGENQPNEMNGKVMETNTSEMALKRGRGADRRAVWLVCIVSLSFLLHLVTRVLSGYAYGVMITLFTMLFFASKRITFRRGNRLAYLWLFSDVVLAVSFLRSQRSNGALLDVIVFTCGFLLFLFFSEEETTYLRCLSAIKAFAIFFSAGVLLQRFLPAAYRSVVAVFPSDYRAALGGGRAGFTPNTGYSAGYIIAGLLSCLSAFAARTSRLRLKRCIVPFCLAFALLLTGKRGPTLFASLTLVYCYLVPVKGSRKMRRYWRMFLIVGVLALCVWLFGESLSSIPVIGRFAESISELSVGEDITSGRLGLYRWALQLFREHPMLGIGWGRYRTTVVGNVTRVKSLETHNIYLQLLAETGIVGFLAFMTALLTFWSKSRAAYRDCALRDDGGMRDWRRLLFFSHAYQTYFLLYGLTGNPLYDPHFQIMYIFSCMIYTAYASVAARCTAQPCPPAESASPAWATARRRRAAVSVTVGR